MTLVLLFLLFFVMLAADTLGLNLGLAPGLSLKNAFLYLIFAGIMIETALKRNRKMELGSIIVPYSLCFFYAALTVVVAVLFIEYSRYHLLPSLISLKSGFADNLLVLLVFFYGILIPKNTLSLIKMMIWTVIAWNLLTVVDGVDLPNLGLFDERLDGRIGGPIGESNQYAAFLTLFLPASVALALIERGILRALAVLGVAVSLLALLMTASRGGFLGVIGGAAIGAVFLRQFISGKSVMSAILCMAALAIAAVGILYLAGYSDLLYNRVIGDSTSGNSTTISSGRVYIWTMALNKMIEHPISLVTGYGWDTYSQFRVFRYAPHNSYLKIFFELGMVGLTLVLLTFANILRVARRALRQAESEASIILFAFIFGLMSILVAIFFVDITTPWVLIWAYVGTALRFAILQCGSANLVANAGVRSRNWHRSAGMT